ncbi:MAG: ammonium transporter [Verrucomicrobiota bacterium]
MSMPVLSQSFYRFLILVALMVLQPLTASWSQEEPTLPMAPTAERTAIIEELQQTVSNSAPMQLVQEQDERIKLLEAEILRMTKAELAAADLSAEAELKTMADVEAKFAEIGFSINLVWVLLAGFLVMFMQAGFAMVEAGFTRAKNCAHTVGMNLMDYAICALVWWAFGFAFMFGGSEGVDALGPGGENLNVLLGFTTGSGEDAITWGMIGGTGFFMADPALFTGAVFTLFLFQLVFLDTAATIPTGTLAERWKFGPFCVMAIFIAGFIYPIFGNWVWGGGWLSQLGDVGWGVGYVDFAGSSVVHLTGAMIGLAGAVVIGPRYGKFNQNGTSNPIPGHNIPMAFLGTFILAFGWFGFNAGSTLSGMDAHIGIVAANTAIASCAGALVAALVTWVKFDKPDPSFMANGMLSGLVAITASCAFVDMWAAVVIGAVAGILVVFSALFIEETLKIDDPVGAISVHGTCGIWGVLSVGLLANGKYSDVTGVFYDSSVGVGQLGAQVIGILACIVWVFVTSWLVFMFLEKTWGNRTEVADEIAGLDIPELGALGYQADMSPESR